MDAQWKEKWCAALRSGRFKQAYGVLRESEDCGCCLYVLTELVRREHPEVGKWSGDGVFIYTTDEGWQEEADGALAPPVQAIVGIKDGDPILGAATAITLNDQHKADFNFIADQIEKYL